MDEQKAKEAFEHALSTYKQEFGEFFLARLFGLTVGYEEGACIVDFELQDFMFNPQGSLHGGVIAMAMDISMGHLLKHEDGAGATLEMKVQYLKAARSGRLQARGEFLRKGRELSFLQSSLRDEEGKLVAFATSTWKKL
ncbi:MAG: hypothetical protein JWP36_43 [Paucimonas sp.]|nr:hypothetical protein [Paucimonas sp.]